MKNHTEVDVPQIKKRTKRIRKRCQVENCEKIDVGGGRCKRHGGGRRCIWDGCNTAARSNGLCSKHGGGKRCIVEGCTRAAQVDDKCARHGGIRYCKYPDCKKFTQIGGFCATHGGPRFCLQEHCSKQAVRGGYCRKHGDKQKRQCIEAGCTNFNITGGYCVTHRKKYKQTIEQFGSDQSPDNLQSHVPSTIPIDERQALLNRFVSKSRTNVRKQKHTTTISHDRIQNLARPVSKPREQHGTSHVSNHEYPNFESLLIPSNKSQSIQNMESTIPSMEVVQTKVNQVFSKIKFPDIFTENSMRPTYPFHQFNDSVANLDCDQEEIHTNSVIVPMNDPIQDPTYYSSNNVSIEALKKWQEPSEKIEQRMIEEDSVLQQLQAHSTTKEPDEATPANIRVMEQFLNQKGTRMEKYDSPPDTSFDRMKDMVLHMFTTQPKTHRDADDSEIKQKMVNKLSEIVQVTRNESNVNSSQTSKLGFSEVEAMNISTPKHVHHGTSKKRKAENLDLLERFVKQSHATSETINGEPGPLNTLHMDWSKYPFDRSTGTMNDNTR